MKMLTNEDIDDILKAIDVAIGESYEPIHATGWSEIENILQEMKAAKQSIPTGSTGNVVELLVCDDCEIYSVYDGRSLDCIQCEKPMNRVVFVRQSFTAHE